MNDNNKAQELKNSLKTMSLKQKQLLLIHLKQLKASNVPVQVPVSCQKEM